MFTVIGCGGSPATNSSSTSTNNKQFVLNIVPLVSNVEGAAAHRDGKLTDAWGLEFGHTGRIWVNNSSGYSTVYDGNGNRVMVDVGGQQVPLAVKVPVPNDPDGDAQAPLTGMVFNQVKNAFLGDSFIFASEQGTIAGWDEPMKLNAVMRVDSSAKGVVYKGLTSANTPQGRDFTLPTFLRARSMSLTRITSYWMWRENSPILPC
jgi:hypothetical protein